MVKKVHTKLSKCQTELRVLVSIQWQGRLMSEIEEQLRFHII